MPADLSLRRTVIADRIVPDDYEVIWAELAIGRIFKQVAVGAVPGGDAGLSEAWRRSCAAKRAAASKVRIMVMLSCCG